MKIVSSPILFQERAWLDCGRQWPLFILTRLFSYRSKQANQKSISSPHPTASDVSTPLGFGPVYIKHGLDQQPICESSKHSSWGKTLMPDYDSFLSTRLSCLWSHWYLLSGPFESFLGLGSQTSFPHCEFLSAPKITETFFPHASSGDCRCLWRFSTYPRFWNTEFLCFFAWDVAWSQK